MPTSADFQSWQPLLQVPAGPVTRTEHIVDKTSTSRKFDRAITPANLLVIPGGIGEVTLAAGLCDHMVLQCEFPLPFRGTAPIAGDAPSVS